MCFVLQKYIDGHGVSPSCTVYELYLSLTTPVPDATLRNMEAGLVDREAWWLCRGLNYAIEVFKIPEILRYKNAL